MVAGETLVELSGAALGYGRKVVVEKADVEIVRGDFLFVVGPNGAGKSTLLSTLLGTRLPLRGAVSRAADLAGQKRVGFVPQRCAMDRSLRTTVREFVSLGLVGIRCDSSSRRERLAWALAQTGLEGFDRRDYWTLSDGQRQRVLIARALVRRPLLMLLDEPTVGLDLRATEGLLGCLADLWARERLAIVFVTHELDLALRHGRRFALCGGGCVTAGEGREVLTSANLERAYGLPMTVDFDGPRPLIALRARARSIDGESA